MSSKSNLKAHPYKLHKSTARQQQHTTGHKSRHNTAYNALTGNTVQSKQRNITIDTNKLHKLKKSLDSNLQRQTQRDLKHNNKIERISREHMLRDAMQNMHNTALHSDSNVHNDSITDGTSDTDIVKRRYYFRELKQIVESSDILLEVLDARDPLGCRCLEIERLIQAQNSNGVTKRIVLVLNKIDLVPMNVVQQWIKYLRREYPVIAFKSSTQSQRSNLSSASYLRDIKTVDDNSTQHSGAIGGNALLELLKNFSRSLNMKKHITVGLFGYPNVGKSSIINSMKRTRAVSVSSTPGHTKTLQEVKLDSHISLLDSPGVMFDINDTDASESLLLRNCLRVEQLTDPITAVNGIVKRCSMLQLQQIYNIDAFDTTEQFVSLVAAKRGKLGKGGVPDIQAASRAILIDWNEGRIPFHTVPPQHTDIVETDVVSDYAKEFDIDKLLHVQTIKDMETE